MPKKKTTPAKPAEGVDTAEPTQDATALSVSEQKFRDLVENISEVIYEIDEQGVISYISPAVSAFGYSAEEITGRRFAEFIHPEDLPRALESVQKAFAGDPEPYELRIVTRSGDLRWVRSTARPILERRRVVGLRGAMRDTTERQQAREALRESAENFRALSENAHDGIVIVDETGKFLYANRQFTEISGYDLDELLGMSMQVTIHSDHLDLMTHVLQERISGEEASSQYEITGIRKDGAAVPVELTAARTTWRGKPAVMGVVRDIRERKRVDEALRLAEFSLDHASIGAFWMGPDARFIYVNETACRKLGYTRDELLSMAVFDIDPNFPEEKWADHWEEVKARRTFTIESSHRAKDGTLFPVEITINYLEFEGREYNFAFARDITARKKTQDALEERLRFESRTAELSASFINLPAGKIDEEIDRGLRRLVEHMGIDRATVIELVEDTGKLRVTHSVAADGFEPAKPLVEMPEFSWAVQKIRKGETIRYSRIEELPAEADFEKKHFRQEGPKSNLTIPLTVEGEVLGAVAFGTLQAERDWPGELVRGLQLVGQIIASALVRKRADQALRRSEEEKATILDSVEELVSYQDRDLRVVWANRAAGKTVGVSGEDLVGRHCHEIWHGREEPCEHCPVVVALDSGQPETAEIVTPDGRVWSIHGYPVRGDDGSITGVVEVTLEITEQRRAAEALRTSEHQYRTTLDSMADAIHVVDRNLQVTLFNKSFAEWNARLGLDTDVLGKGLFEVFPFLPEKIRTEYERVFETGEPLQTDESTEVLGETLYTDTTKIPVFHEGRVDRVVTVIRDVTDIKRAEEERQKLRAQIQHTQKLESLGILAGGIAHDFNNLLMGVLGNAELAMSDLPSTSPTLENLKSIETAAKRAADLCRQMLAYSGKGRFLVQALDLNAVVGEMAHLLEVSISKTAALSYDLAAGLPTIEADATQIRQIVLNLITNASEAIGDAQGVVKITTGVTSCSRENLAETYMGHDLEEGDYVYVDVTDTGCGMDAETMERIFDPFFTTKFTGRGLGLAAVLGIVRGHEGALKVTSEPGEGTAFRVLFPASGKPADEAVEEEKPGNTDWQTSGTILVIDDEDTVRSVTRRMLERRGLNVLTASDGGEGVELYRQHSGEITAVILDLAMPRVGGDETFEALRRINPAVRVVLASGYSEQELSERFADRGLAGFIQKPFQVGTILQRLREAIGDES